MNANQAIANKLNIKSSVELKRVEERESKKAIIEMWDSGELLKLKSGSVQLLQYIHFKTFYNIYDWAGEIRDVQLAKDSFQFSNVLYIDDNLKLVEKMPNSTFEEIIEKYAEMNIVHPFLEGNGRTTRVWLDDMLKRNIGMVVDWNNIGEREYLEAMIKSHTNTEKLRDILKENLTNDLDDREIFFKGLDSSYYYEGMYEFEAEKIARDILREVAINLQYLNGNLEV